MQQERDSFVGCDRYECTCVRHGYRNGFQRRMLDTRWGPLLLAWGVRHSGREELIDFRPLDGETAGNWTAFMTDLQARGLGEQNRGSGRRQKLGKSHLPGLAETGKRRIRPYKASNNQKRSCTNFLTLSFRSCAFNAVREAVN